MPKRSNIDPSQIIRHLQKSKAKTIWRPLVEELLAASNAAHNKQDQNLHLAKAIAVFGKVRKYLTEDAKL